MASLPPIRPLVGVLGALVACGPGAGAARPASAAPRVDIGVVHVSARARPASVSAPVSPGGASPPPASPAEIALTEPPELRAGLTLSIPTGQVPAGSRPGTPGRDARAEADAGPVTVPAFTIDALPYPNDPGASPRTGVSRDEAEVRCDAEGKRLCEELEWERACEGPEGTGRFGSGAELASESCAAQPRQCRSDFGVAALGTHLGEWTASPARRGLGSPVATAVFRGAAAEGAPPLHRCGARRAAVPTTRSRHLTFRCCGGPAPDLRYPEEAPLARFKVVEDGGEVLAAAGRLPELAGGGERLHLSAGEAAIAAVPDPALLRGWELVPTGVLRWAPVPGEEIWVLSARSATASLVLALFREREGSFSHAASFILEGERAPIALAFTPPSPRELQWSADWGRAGEGGSVRYDEGRVLITQR